MSLLEKIFGNYSEKEVKKLKPIVAKSIAWKAPWRP